MYLPDPAPQQDSRALELLEAATGAPLQSCQDDPELKEAFDQSLRELAEDILQYHPGLAHVLLGMGDAPCPVVHGQN